MTAHQHNTTIIRHPSFGIYEVDDTVDWFFITRKDTDFATRPMAQQLAHELGDRDKVTRVLRHEYNALFQEFVDLFLWSFGYRKNPQHMELHIFEEEPINTAVFSKAAGLGIVSMDPLVGRQMEVSKGFEPGGKKFIDLVARPGAPTIQEQIGLLVQKYGSQPVCLIDDSFMTADSLSKVLMRLLAAGLKVEKIITGVQVGHPAKLERFNVPTDPVIRYRQAGDLPLDDRFEIYDQRELVVGIGGLATRLPSGAYGRAPYVLPFIDVAARYGLPEVIQREFSIRALYETYTFYATINSQLNCTVRLRHGHPAFALLMYELYGMNQTTPMTDIIKWLLAHFDRVWEGNLTGKVNGIRYTTHPTMMSAV